MSSAVERRRDNERTTWQASLVELCIARMISEIGIYSVSSLAWRPWSRRCASR
jgi:hypothetical protein